MAGEIADGQRLDDLTQKIDAITRMGSMMLAAGTGSYRVKVAMGRVAGALGIERLDAQVTLTEIVLTAHENNNFRTEVSEVPVPSVNADRISALLRVSMRTRSGDSAATLQRRLDEVENRKPLLPAGALTLAAAIACAAFAFLNNGSWLDCIAAAVGAGVGKATQIIGGKMRTSQLVVTACASVMACLIYVLVSSVFHGVLTGSGWQVHAGAFTSAVLFLVPGFPLVTASIDMARFDFTSGVSRALYATLVTMAASLGAWTIALGFHVVPESITSAPATGLALVGLQIVASFLGIFGFAATFNTPWLVAFAAAGIGTIANVARLTAIGFGANSLLATVLATTVVGLLAAFMSPRVLAPRITLSVPAVLIMIPGAPTFRAVVELINGDILQALVQATTSLVTVLGLVSGLVIARMMTDPVWVSSRVQWTKMPRTSMVWAIRDLDAEQARDGSTIFRRRKK